MIESLIVWVISILILLKLAHGKVTLPVGIIVFCIILAPIVLLFTSVFALVDYLENKEVEL